MDYIAKREAAKLPTEKPFERVVVFTDAQECDLKSNPPMPSVWGPGGIRQVDRVPEGQQARFRPEKLRPVGQCRAFHRLPRAGNALFPRFRCSRRGN
jgi:hypothetical protein